MLIHALWIQMNVTWILLYNLLIPRENQSGFGSSIINFVIKFDTYFCGEFVIMMASSYIH